MRPFVGSVVFVSGALKGVGSRENKVLYTNTTSIGVWRFLYKQIHLLDLVFSFTTENTFALARKTDLPELAKGDRN